MEINEIKGFGPKRIDMLKKAGFKDPVDLLYYFPYDYLSQDNTFDNTDEGSIAVVQGKIEKIKFNYISRSLIISSADIITDRGTIKLKWFNQKFIKKAFIDGNNYCVYGLKKKNGKEEYVLNPKKVVFDKPIIPLYNSIEGINGSLIAFAIETILKNYTVKSLLPPNIETEYGISDLNKLFSDIHLAQNLQTARENRVKLALYHLTLQIAAFRISQPQTNKKRNLIYTKNEPELTKAVESLPYRLTEEQNRVLTEIINSFHSDTMMNRLIQGDVGCGKTIIALLSMYYAYLSGYQSVLMAPTELLCEQHYSAAMFFERFGVKVVMLTGSQSKTLRQQILFDIKNGVADFIIATHSVLNDNIEFYNLGLNVTDEQQRFGVAQRAMLNNKAPADFITLTATPIPRTLAMVMYGELQHSVIAAKPMNHIKIKTTFVQKSKLKNMFEYFYKKAEAGERTYIICPRIDENSDDELVSCIKLFNELKKTKLNKYLGLLHGRTDDADKIRIMKSFASGEIKILVSTTIIEVGIDVKDATSIAIFNPERYGLSQLHQLRGRVGRGTLDSYCFLITDNKTERLKIFSENDDGFSLAEYDLKTRGAGDFIGLKQHGKSEIMKNMVIDIEMIKQASNVADKLLLSETFRENLKELNNFDFKDVVLN